MLIKKEVQKQHVDYYKKILLRKNLLSYLSKEGDIYVPFIGDGDIAFDLYKYRKIYGADLDPERVKMASGRLLDATIKAADCDKFPFSGIKTKWALADFDSYSYPYDSFRAFWNHKSEKVSPLILFFTDAQRQAIKRTGVWRLLSGEKVNTKDLNEKREKYNKYFDNVIKPWFIEYIKPWHILTVSKYLRKDMLYWGVVISNNDKQESITDTYLLEHKKRFGIEEKKLYCDLLRKGRRRGLAARELGFDYITIYKHIQLYPTFEADVKLAEHEANQSVEESLFQAAQSGNVTAAQVWLYNRMPEEWKDKRAVELTGKDGAPLIPEINILLNKIIQVFLQLPDITEDQKRLFGEGITQQLKEVVPNLIEEPK
jgi:hypothetical protein